MFIVTRKPLNKCHTILKDIMEHTGDGFTWSHSHNSQFELMKLAWMNFSRRNSAPVSAPLMLLKHNSNGSHTVQMVNTGIVYKYLGIHFDPLLSYKCQVEKVILKATWWMAWLWHISKNTGIPAQHIKQLWNTVAVPAFPYAADIWYIKVHTIPGQKNR